MRPHIKRRIALLAILFIIIVYAKIKIGRGNEQQLIHDSPASRSYENVSMIYRDGYRLGYGEQGLAVKLSVKEQKIAEKFLTQNGFNAYISDTIALDRSVADIRYPECKLMMYSTHLPKTSVIIPFFEEHFSTLMRTVFGIFLRSPAGLIKEVILVDDGSSRKYLKQHLDQYLMEHFPNGTVRVLRLPVREGLIRARIHGAKLATGDVLVFLDSHCEPNYNWLPPLLDPIAKDYKTVTCPFIDVIDADTFEYRAQDEGARGAFDWELYYKRLPRLPEDKWHPEKPFDSPVMAGGLFAISSKWFWELGGYDPGLQIWGGEQYELSFKVWMCGGRMIDIPCSRIGHIYRTHPTNFPNNAVPAGDFVGMNYKRVAEVWMDEYKEYIYLRRPQYRDLDPGNLTEQHNIRKRLKCKSFKWFMSEIAFDLVMKYPLIEPISVAIGCIQPVSDQSLCIEGRGGSLQTPVRLNMCYPELKRKAALQSLEFGYRDDISFTGTKDCLDVLNAKQNGTINVSPCHGGKGNQHFSIRPVYGDKQNPLWIQHGTSGYCLQADISSRRVLLGRCNLYSVKQHWIWTIYQPDKAADSILKAGLLT